MKSHRSKFSARHAGFVLLAGTAFVAMLPSAVAAASDAVRSDNGAIASVLSVGSDGLGAFTPASADPRLLQRLRSVDTVSDSGSDIFRFTPAGTVNDAKRAMTIAVRVNVDTARAISIRSAQLAGTDAGRNAGTVPGIAPVAFNLGMARGFQSFAANRSESESRGPASADMLAGTKFGLATGRLSGLAGNVRNLDMPDLSSFTPSKSKPGRFSATVDLDENISAGGVPRMTGNEADVSLDVAGAYRVARNLKVTAGLRYSADRNRIETMTEDQQDSQAVYVGTQFRF